jgi:inorganic triphosphatase YgiF
MPRRVSCEIELELAAPAAEVEKLERAILELRHARFEAQADLVGTYYDTRTCALHRQGLALRLRRQGQELVQTIKSTDPAKWGLLERWEWDMPIESMNPALMHGQPARPTRCDPQGGFATSVHDRGYAKDYRAQSDFNHRDRGRH